MKTSPVIVLVLACFSLTFSASAQDTLSPITDQNIGQLHSVKQIDFADWEGQVGKIENGWFTLDQTGTKVAILDRAGDVVIGDDTGALIDHYSVPGSDNLPTSVQDAAFSVDSPSVVSAHTEGGSYYVAYRNYDTHQTEYFRFDTPDVPLRIWESGEAWLEVSPADYTRSRYVEAYERLTGLRFADWLG